MSLYHFEILVLKWCQKESMQLKYLGDEGRNWGYHVGLGLGKRGFIAVKEQVDRQVQRYDLAQLMLILDIHIWDNQADTKGHAQCGVTYAIQGRVFSRKDS